MKKFLAILMAAMMLLSMATVAMADGGETTTPRQVTLKKAVTVNGSEGVVMPAETFTFRVERVGVTDAATNVTKDNMPLPEVESVSYEAGESGEKDLTIKWPEYNSVGKYTYEIVENAGTTPGMTYDSNARKLTVTVVNDGNGGFKVVGTILVNESDDKKSDSFANTYNAGDLKIEKFVEGQLGDRSKDFDFTVTLSSEHQVKDSLVKFGDTGIDWRIVDGKYIAEVKFSLKHGESKTIKYIPYGVSYTVVEDGTTNTAAEGETPVYMNGDYKVTMTGANGTVNSETATAIFTNTKDGNIETGVSLDTLPYVLVLALAGAGLVLMIARKRRVED